MSITHEPIQMQSHSLQLSFRSNQSNVTDVDRMAMKYCCADYYKIDNNNNNNARCRPPASAVINMRQIIRVISSIIFRISHFH